MLRVCTSSTESSLLSLAAYKAALGTTSTANDSALQSSLDRATALIEGYIGYPLRRQVYQETLAGYGSLELQVTRTPLFAVESVYYGSELVDPTSYDIANQGAGLIYRELGWPWTAGIDYDLMPRIIPKSEARTYTAVYESGYCVNGSTADGWLTTGEPVPAEIEDVIEKTATWIHKGTGKDLSVASKKIGDLSITYQGAAGKTGGGSGAASVGLPDSIKGMISHLVRF